MSTVIAEEEIVDEEKEKKGEKLAIPPLKDKYE